MQEGILVVHFQDEGGRPVMRKIQHINRRAFFIQDPGLPLGDSRSYCLRFPYGDKGFIVTGRVVEQVEQGQGMGIQYILSNPLEGAVFENYLDCYLAARGKPELPAPAEILRLANV